MRTIGSAILAATMIVTSAYAATDTVGPLAPGKPAGVKTAQASSDNTLWWVLGAGVVIGGIALVASGNSSNSVTGALTTTTTTTTSTTRSTASTGTSP